MAVVFSRRPCGYKLGLFLLFFGVVFFLLGFASPYWYKLSTGFFFIHGGLWQTCVQVSLVLRVCTSTPKGSVATDWMSIVQALQCIGLAGLLLACIYATIVNWIQKKPRYTRLLELLGIVSSILGFAGCVVFIVQVESNPTELRKLASNIAAMSPVRHTVSWAVGINLAACVFCLVASFILGLHNPSIPIIEAVAPDVVTYVGPEIGAAYPVMGAANQEAYYITSQSAVGGFQPVSSGFQPPPYESTVAPPPFSEYAPKFNH